VIFCGQQAKGRIDDPARFLLRADAEADSAMEFAFASDALGRAANNIAGPDFTATVARRLNRRRAVAGPRLTP
jgi:hypothetical protein